MSQFDKRRDNGFNRITEKGLTLLCLAGAVAGMPANAVELPRGLAPSTEALGLASNLPARRESASFANNPAAIFSPALVDKWRGLYAYSTLEHSNSALKDSEADQLSFSRSAEKAGFGLSWQMGQKLVAAGRNLASPGAESVYLSNTISLGLGFRWLDTMSLGITADSVDLESDEGDDSYDREWGYSVGWQWHPEPAQMTWGEQVFHAGFASGVIYQKEVRAELQDANLLLIPRTLTARPEVWRAGIEPSLAWLGTGTNMRWRFPVDIEQRSYSAVAGVYSGFPELNELIVTRGSVGVEWAISSTGSDFSLILRGGLAMETPDDDRLPEVTIHAAGIGLISGPHSLNLGGQMDDQDGQQLEIAYQYWL